MGGLAERPRLWPGSRRLFPFRNLGHRAPGRHAGQRGFDQRIGPARRGIVDLAQQPVLRLLLAARFQPDQQPLPLHTLAIEHEVEVALVEVLGALALDRGPGAAVPQHHRPAAIFARRNGPLEIGIGQGMVLGPHRQPFLRGVEARPARHRPAFEHAIDFQPEIPMQPRCVVLLHDEAIAMPGLERARRLRRFREVALGVVFFEGV
ncbi:hypothetical protein D9M73_134610 [compost metagenome]